MRSPYSHKGPAQGHQHHSELGLAQAKIKEQKYLEQDKHTANSQHRPWQKSQQQHPGKRAPSYTRPVDERPQSNNKVSRWSNSCPRFPA